MYTTSSIPFFVSIRFLGDFGMDEDDCAVFSLLEVTSHGLLCQLVCLQLVLGLQGIRLLVVGKR